MRYGAILLLLAGVAHAQPAEDPGLADAPAPPPKPAPPPPPPANANVPAPVSMPPPAALPPPPPEVNETTDVKTEWIAGDKNSDEGDLYDRVAAPTLGGGVGLMRTQTGDFGKQGTFRIGLHAGIFKQDGFIAGAKGTNPGDQNTRFTGDLTISYTPWRFIELYLGIYNSSNQNVRTDTGRTDPKVILALGDLALGLKGRYPVARFVDLALRLEVKLLNSVDSSTISGDSTNVSVDAILSFDLRHAEATKNVPLRFHLNFGYLYDNSLSLLPSGQCASSNSDDACIRSRAVETFAYGIGSERLRMALALDAPVQVKSVGIQPFFEYHLEVALGDGDQTMYRALLHDTELKVSQLEGQIIQYLTFGLRVRPVAGLILDAALDVGLQSPGFQYGPPQPAWNLLLGAAYAYDGGARKTKSVTKTITREIARGVAEGKIRGIIRDAKTKKPVGGAGVRYINRLATAQLTADDGTFLSYGFTPGPVTLEVSRDDYEPVKLDVQVVAHGETPLEVLLTPKPPAAGQVRVRVSDPAGGPIGMASVHLSSATGKSLDGDNEGAGTFSAKPTAGDWTVDITADGFLGKQRQVVVAPGQVQSLEITLSKKPTVSHVQLTANEIAIKGTIHFGTTNADILPDGQQLLDEVGDVLVKNGQIRKLRIEGHTDNRGVPEKNLQLSQARAAAVLAYLVKQGIDAARLESQGFGASQPLVPNLTPGNRAKNRRVTFRILEQGTAP